MDAIEINATLQKRQSKKGNSYYVVVVELTDSCEKLVFLDNAELELVKLHYSDEI